MRIEAENGYVTIELIRGNEASCGIIESGSGMTKIGMRVYNPDVWRLVRAEVDNIIKVLEAQENDDGKEAGEEGD